MKSVLVVFFCVLFSGLRAQTWSLEAAAGYGVNKQLMLYDEPVQNGNAFVAQTMVRYEFKVPRTRRFNIFLGLGGKYCLNHADTRPASFTSQVIRLTVPVGVQYAVNGRWNVQAGVQFQNNRDFGTHAPGQIYNNRGDGFLQVSWVYNSHYSFTMKTCGALHDQGDAFFVYDPRWSVCFGIQFNLNSRRAKS